jgi:vacuolar-type H+-ATPase subunit I/STV1
MRLLIYLLWGGLTVALKIIGLLYRGLVALFTGIGNAIDRKEAEQVAAQRVEAINQQVEIKAMHDEEKINSLENQIQIELALASECMRRAQCSDVYKSLSWQKKALQAESRADALQEKINKIKGN